MTEGTTATASTELCAERADFATIEEPQSLAYEWPPKSGPRPPPPPEMRRFVRAMSVLGVPVKEIARRVQQRIRARHYHTNTLYKDFQNELLVRAERGKREHRRTRMVAKHEGWRPVCPGAPFSYADVIAVLQSDMDSRDLARLYGVNDALIYKMRRGESKYTRTLVPKILLTQERASPQDLAYRARVTSNMAVKLVDQMASMIENFLGLMNDQVIENPMSVAPPQPSKQAATMYRKNAETGTLEERQVTTALERKAAFQAGWRVTKPE